MKQYVIMFIIALGVVVLNNYVRLPLIAPSAPKATTAPVA